MSSLAWAALSLWRCLRSGSCTLPSRAQSLQRRLTITAGKRIINNLHHLNWSAKWVNTSRLYALMRLLQACTFKPEQMSSQKAAKGRALLMSGAGGLDSPARCSRFSTVSALDDLDKYEVSTLPLWGSLFAACILALRGRWRSCLVETHTMAHNVSV